MESELEVYDDKKQANYENNQRQRKSILGDLMGLIKYRKDQMAKNQRHSPKITKSPGNWKYIHEENTRKVLH